MQQELKLSCLIIAGVSVWSRSGAAFAEGLFCMNCYAECCAKRIHFIFCRLKVSSNFVLNKINNLFSVMFSIKSLITQQNFQLVFSASKVRNSKLLLWDPG